MSGATVLSILGARNEDTILIVCGVGFALAGIYWLTTSESLTERFPRLYRLPWVKRPEPSKPKRTGVRLARSTYLNKGGSIRNQDVGIDATDSDVTVEDTEIE